MVVMVRGTLIIEALEIAPSDVMSQVHIQPGGGSPMEHLLHRKTATSMLDRGSGRWEERLWQGQESKVLG